MFAMFELGKARTGNQRLAEAVGGTGHGTPAHSAGAEVPTGSGPLPPEISFDDEFERSCSHTQEAAPAVTTGSDPPIRPAQPEGFAELVGMIATLRQEQQQLATQLTQQLSTEVSAAKVTLTSEQRKFEQFDQMLAASQSPARRSTTAGSSKERSSSLPGRAHAKAAPATEPQPDP